MTMKTAACAIAVSVLAGTIVLPAPATAQSAPMPPGVAKKLYLSAAYNAGLRRGSAYAVRNAYNRGYRDGANSVANNPQAYVADPYAGAPAASDPGYSSYGGAAAYNPDNGGYSSYHGHYAYYGDANRYGDGRYGDGFAPLAGLVNVVAAPLAAAPYATAPDARLSYCAARYQSFDPVSGTFLAYDGNRYYCR
jgi:hypothetical protein